MDTHSVFVFSLRKSICTWQTEVSSACRGGARGAEGHAALRGLLCCPLHAQFRLSLRVLYVSVDVPDWVMQAVTRRRIACSESRCWAFLRGASSVSITRKHLLLASSQGGMELSQTESCFCNAPVAISDCSRVHALRLLPLIAATVPDLL
jgi:hypothetical protein